MKLILKMIACQILMIQASRQLKIPLKKIAISVFYMTMGIILNGASITIFSPPSLKIIFSGAGVKNWFTHDKSISYFGDEYCDSSDNSDEYNSIDETCLSFAFSGSSDNNDDNNNVDETCLSSVSSDYNDDYNSVDKTCLSFVPTDYSHDNSNTNDYSHNNDNYNSVTDYSDNDDFYNSVGDYNDNRDVNNDGQNDDNTCLSSVTTDHSDNYNDSSDSDDKSDGYNKNNDDLKNVITYHLLSPPVTVMITAITVMNTVITVMITGVTMLSLLPQKVKTITSTLVLMTHVYHLLLNVIPVPVNPKELTWIKMVLLHVYQIL